jgi:hypothetical protein
MDERHRGVRARCTRRRCRRPAASRAASAQNGPAGAGISAVSLFVSQPDRFGAFLFGAAGSSRKRTARSRGAQESCGNLHDRVGTGDA